MSTKIVLAAAIFACVSAGQAVAESEGGAIQATLPSVASSAAGHWLYGPQGNIIGSVRSVAADGRTAVIMVGSYFQLGSHEVKVSANRLSTIGGKVTLRAETAEALNTATRR